MNILFVYRNVINPQVGGVERVSTVLTELFEHNGHTVYYMSTNNGQYNVLDSRQFILPDSNNINSEINKTTLSAFIEKHSIDIIINQGATDSEFSQLIFEAKKDSNIKIISIIHNSPLALIKNFSVVFYDIFAKYHLQFILFIFRFKTINKLLLWLYKIKHRNHYKSVYRNSDKLLVLSKGFYEEIQYLLNETFLPKLSCIPNPISFSFDNINLNLKRKELLYVGRIDTTQKKIDFLIVIWSKICHKHTDWTLNIVGDGPALEDIKKLSIKNNCINLIFHGFQDPKEFYKTASIFCMTSTYEGLSMSILEAISYGLVPIGFNSFLSIRDTISDNNGITITPFDLDEYARQLSYIMSNDKRRILMSQNSILKSHSFSKQAIAAMWNNLFIELKK